jgi:hypothetical protein
LKYLSGWNDNEFVLSFAGSVHVLLQEVLPKEG